MPEVFSYKKIWISAAIAACVVAIFFAAVSPAFASRHTSGASNQGQASATSGGGTAGSVSKAAAQGTNTGQGSTGAKRVEEITAAPKGLKCGISAMDHCLAFIGYYLFFVPAGFMLFLAGSLFDLAMGFALSGYLINLPVTMELWGVLRDIANLGFIVALIYGAVTKILDVGEMGAKTVVSIVVVALLLNFSAFFTKVAIDASNILALEFYNAIEAPAGPLLEGSEFPFATKSLSSVFVTGFDPQKITGSESFQSWKERGGNAIPLFLIFLGSGIVTYFAAYVLMRAAFLFVGLAVDFAYLVVMSPLAFITHKSMGSLLGEIGYWKTWYGELVKRLKQMPVFLLGIYIIARVIQGPTLEKVFAGNTVDYVDILVSATILFVVLYYMMNKILKMTEYEEKEKSAGKSLLNYAGAGIATRFLARQPGRAASTIVESERFKGLARKSPRLGGVAYAGLKAVEGYKLGKEIPSYGEYRKAGVEKRQKFIKDISSEIKLPVIKEFSKMESETAEDRQKIADAITKTQKEILEASEITEEQEKIYENLTKTSLGTLVGKVTGSAAFDREAVKKLRKESKQALEDIKEKFEEEKAKTVEKKKRSLEAKKEQLKNLEEQLKNLEEKSEKIIEKKAEKSNKEGKRAFGIESKAGAAARVAGQKNA